MPATIKDIARRLNVSISTVSYALNGGPRCVAPDVREKVLAVARELNYRPNSLARSMATGRTDTIAIVPPRGARPIVLSPYFQAILDGCVEAAESLSQDILLHTCRTDGDADGIRNSIFGGRADGVFLIAPRLESTIAAEIAAQGLPCVVFSAEGPPGTVTVTIDNAAAMRQAMDHLLALGHSRIAHIYGRLGMRDGMLRRDAFVEYVRGHSMPVRDEWLLAGDFAYRDGREAARALLASSDRPTAIVAANDESGVGVMDAAADLGLRIPEDLSIIAFDALPQETLSSRHLTSVRQPFNRMIERGFEVLVQWARDGAPPEQARYTFPTELKVGQTTGPPPYS